MVIARPSVISVRAADASDIVMPVSDVYLIRTVAVLRVLELAGTCVKRANIVIDGSP